MKYLDQDFRKCVFNPLADNLLAAYPELKRELGDDIRLIRYTIAIYDPGSPLHADIPEWNRRKEVAAELAGYDLETDEEFLAGLFSGSDEESLGKMHLFLRVFVRSEEWAMIASNIETFWEYNLRLKQPIAKVQGASDKEMMMAIEKKTKLAEDQEAFYNRIKRLKKEFFNGDDELAEASGDLKINFSAEGIAKQLNNNK